jgi:hypothetical protein
LNRPDDDDLNLLASSIYRMTSTDLPVMRADWFLAAHGEAPTRTDELTAEQLAMEFDFETSEAFLAIIADNKFLQEGDMQAILRGGTIAREDWERIEGLTSLFQRVASALRQGTPKQILPESNVAPNSEGPPP